MERFERAAPLPAAMQGRWIDADDPAAELVVAGGEVTCFGRRVGYDHKYVDRVDGAVSVSLRVDDPAREDGFQRENVTELVLTPEGTFHAANVRFASRFTRAADGSPAPRFPPCAPADTVVP